jgi:hypothetical protein
MQHLASVFGIDVLAYAILQDQLQIVMRNRPDVVNTWSERDVASRWLKVFPGRRIDEQLASPTPIEAERMAKNAERMRIIRTRLSDPSWFMKALCEPIARMANKQDESHGNFWEGRFKAITITDEAALLACTAHVDLHAAWAAISAAANAAENESNLDLELSGNETVQDSKVASTDSSNGRSDKAATPTVATKASANSSALASIQEILPTVREEWLVPLTMKPTDRGRVLPSRSHARASDLGFLSIEWDDYRELLRWTSLQREPVKKTLMPMELVFILRGLGIESSMWVDLILGYMKYFGQGRAAGSPQSLKRSAQSHDCKFFRGQSAVSRCFVNG